MQLEVVVVILGAIFAAIGYLVKTAVEEWRSIDAARSARLASLAELQSLLHATRVSFDIQQEHTHTILKSLKERRALAPGTQGYDESMAVAYQHFTPEERELHALIRGITMFAVRPINLAITGWLSRDTVFKGMSKQPGLAGELARKLADLGAHLALWQAKYEVWIPNHAERALVYMDDEKRHGLGFPEHLDELVNKALKERRWFWS